MAQINLYEAKAQFSRLVDRAAAGEEIIIAKGGRAMARLAPLGPGTAAREAGFLAGRVRMGDDFNAPLPDAIAAAFGARRR